MSERTLSSARRRARDGAARREPRIDERVDPLGHLSAGRAAVAGVPASSSSCRSPRSSSSASGTTTSTRIIPAFVLHQLRGAADSRRSPGGPTCNTLQLRRHRLGAHAADRLHGRLFPRLPRPLADLQMVLFLVCTVPFLTSNIIRMISWIPFLGRNGLLNSALSAARPDRRSRWSSCCSPTSPSCWR